MNEIIVLGRLTKDPELKTTANANEIAKFTVADDQGYGDKKTTNFWDCTVFGKQAAFVKTYLKKGSAVALTGCVTITKKEDGKKYEDIAVNKIEFQQGNSKLEDTHQSVMPVVAPSGTTELVPGEELPF